MANVATPNIARRVKRLRMRLRGAIDPLSKNRFIYKLRAGCAILDVGCGNGSPSIFKLLNPSIFYTGIDIQPLGLTAADRDAADQLVFVGSSEFAGAIRSLGSRFDAVVSAHNIEHTEQPEAVIRAMCAVLRPGGTLYLSFPAAASTRFPPRNGSLNFYDDPTHRWVPDLPLIREQVEASSCKIIVVTARNRPWIGRLIGCLVEPISRWRNQVMPCTWHYWGFESVVVAMKSGGNQAS